MSIVINDEMEYLDLVGLTEILGWKDITTKQQEKNGTKIFKLPIKMYGRYIKVGSFKSGYVRRLECIGYRSDSSYQLNKRVESGPDYYKTDKKDSMGRPLYTQFTTRTCKLISDKRDRLEYLITYCLKNYYIKQANQVENGEFIPKWVHEERCGHFLKVHDTGDMINFKYSGGQIENLENGDIFVHEQHAYWNKREEPEVKVIINGQKYNIT
jgi:hypothetical protein